MQAIIERLIAFGEFEVEVFDDDVTLHKPITEWPLCDVLLSWHSDGFPLDKVWDVPARQAAHKMCVLFIDASHLRAHTHLFSTARRTVGFFLWS